MRLDILYQFNEEYVAYAGISLTSLLENNKKIEQIIIHVLLENVKNESRQKLIDLANKYGRQIIFIETQELISKIEDIGINDYRGSYATNMKMFAPLYMDDSVERLLYIDSDTIINGHLEELITIDMNGKPLAMVLDSLCDNHKLHIGLDKEDPYFNGGVMLIDVNKWKQKRCTERIVEHAQNVRAHYLAPDQDLINIVLHGEIDELDIRYNLQPIHVVYEPALYDKFFKPVHYYNNLEIESAVKSFVIFHMFRFLGEFPWHKNSLHPGVSYFDKYMKVSLWKDYEKTSTTQNGVTFRIERWLYRHLPKAIFLQIFKVNYDFFIWKSNQDSLKNRNNKKM